MHTLSTGDSRSHVLEVADATWHHAEDRPTRDRCAAVATAITELGLLVASSVTESASCPHVLEITACDGTSMTLSWDPMIDGYSAAGTAADREYDDLDTEPEAEPLEAMFSDEEIEDFIGGYVRAMLWSSCPASSHDDQTFSRLGYAARDVEPDTLEAIRSDCRAFLLAAGDVLNRVRKPDESMEDPGIDFWLSRNGHGAGYFDRGREPEWRRLQDLSRPYGEFPLDVRDGRVYGLDVRAGGAS